MFLNLHHTTNPTGAGAKLRVINKSLTQSIKFDVSYPKDYVAVNPSQPTVVKPGQERRLLVTPLPSLQQRQLPYQDKLCVCVGELGRMVHFNILNDGRSEKNPTSPSRRQVEI